jgi:hypothetical protein
MQIDREGISLACMRVYTVHVHYSTPFPLPFPQLRRTSVYMRTKLPQVFSLHHLVMTCKR